MKSGDLYPKQMNFRLGAEPSNNRSVYEIHDCCENGEGNNTEDSSEKGIFLREYCLKLMGITSWAKRSNSAQKAYLLVIDDTLRPATHQLLLKILQALKWPRTLSQVEEITDIANNFFEMISQGDFKKVLLFGENLKEDLSLTVTSNPFSLLSVEMALLPALSVLLTDVAAKKRAWGIMQKLHV